MKIPSQSKPSLALQETGFALPIVHLAMLDPCWDSWHGDSFPTREYNSVGEEESLFAYIMMSLPGATSASLPNLRVSTCSLTHAYNLVERKQSPPFNRRVQFPQDGSTYSWR